MILSICNKGYLKNFRNIKPPVRTTQQGCYAFITVLNIKNKTQQIQNKNLGLCLLFCLSSKFWEKERTKNLERFCALGSSRRKLTISKAYCYPVKAMFVKPIKLSLILTTQEENHTNTAKPKNSQWDLLAANKQLSHALMSAVGTLPAQMSYHLF